MERSHAEMSFHDPKSTLGAPPGTLVAPAGARPSSVHVIAYGADDFLDEPVTDLGVLPDIAREWPVVWVNVDGLGDVNAIGELGDLFGLHRLALEDVMNIHHRAKAEDYGNHLFIVVRMMEPDLPVRTEQLSIFVGEGFVVTFQEHAGDCLDTVRERIRKGRGRIREMGADYLSYCLVDAVIDFYFPSLDAFSDSSEHLEHEVLNSPARSTVSRIHRAKRDLLAIRRAVSPLREALGFLVRDSGEVVTDVTRLHYRDCQDHVHQILEMVETQRELVTGLLDLYLSSVSNKMNDVMKILTVIATTFIPLTFLAGIYGMNFDPEASPWNMPELSWPYGYPGLLLLMLVIGVIELVLFWKAGWLTPGRNPDDEGGKKK